MTDSRDEQEPITGSDPTNGLAGDLDGDRDLVQRRGQAVRLPGRSEA